MFPIAFIVFIILQIIVPDVIVISSDSGTFTHESKSMLSSIGSPSGQKFALSLNNKYIANFSDEQLILYPEYYGPANRANSVKAKDPIIIEPYSVVKVEISPDYYFTQAASQISSKSNPTFTPKKIFRNFFDGILPKLFGNLLIVRDGFSL